jgi:hypothetical protein
VTLLDSHLNPIVVDDTPDQVSTTVALTTATVQMPNAPKNLLARKVLPFAPADPAIERLTALAAQAPLRRRALLLAAPNSFQGVASGG